MPTSGNVTKVTDALGGVTTYSYDSQGNELSKTDANGNTVNRVIDLNTGKVFTETDALNHSTSNAYNTVPGANGPSPNTLKTLTDANGNVTTFGYDPNDNPTSITDANGKVTGMQWNGGNLTQLKDALGNATQYVYDSKGRRTKETDATGAVTQYGFDANGNQTSTTRTRTVNGQVVAMSTSRTLDGDGNALTETDALGNVTQTSYTPLKKVDTSTDAKGRITRYGYDNRGYQTSVTLPDGTSEQTAFDANGNETIHIDAAGRSTVTTFDALNRPTQVTNPDGSFTQSQYDAGGRLTQTTDERGNTSSFEYDAAGRRTKITDALGNITLSAYDANGNLTQITDPAGNVTTYTYDATNRRTKTTFAAVNGVTSSVTTGYDAAGRKVSDTDEAGNVTQYGYDGVGRLTKVTDAMGGITQYGYDEAGNKISQTDALGHITRWDYDHLGRVTKRTLPEGMAESFTFDAAGNVASHTDFNGAVMSYTYDANNRLQKRTDPIIGTSATTDTVYTYTLTGQVATVTDQNGQIGYTYDQRDRLTKVQNPDGSQLSYTYDPAGNRATITSQTGAEASRTTGYSYDNLNRLATLTDPNGKQTTYAYDAVGNLKSTTLPNGIRTDNFFDARNRLTGIEHRRVADNVQLGSITYTLSANGLRAQVSENFAANGAAGAGATPTRTISYQYDALKRLVQETQTNGTRSIHYMLDAVGNRVAADGQLAGTSVFDRNDRIQSVSQPNQSQTFGYDLNGNTTRVQTTATGATAPTTADLSWDANGRLIGQNLTAPGSTPIASRFTYDADGIRIAATRGTTPTITNATNYVYDKNRAYAQVLEERDGAGSLVVSYVYSDAGPISQTRNVGTIANPVWATSYFLADGLGSVRLIADANGAVSDSFDYGAYGELLSQGSAGAATANSVLFAGEQYDPTLGLYYNRARYLNVGVGRFAAMDSFAGNLYRTSSLNKYGYAEVNPISRTDPSGRYSLAELGESIDVQGALTNFAKDQASSYFRSKIFGEDDRVDGTPSLYEMLLGMLIKNVAGSFSTPNGLNPPVGLVSLAAVGGGKTQGHHVIPEYMCGASKQIDLVDLPTSQHSLLHNQLYAFKTAVTLGSTIYRLTFRKKISPESLAPIAEVARTHQGRLAIGIGLAAFYSEFGFGGASWMELGIGQKTKAPLGVVLGFEAIEFAGNNHSYPTCKKQ